MDDRSDHTGDPEKEDGDVESLASRLSGIKTSSGPQSPAEPAEPEPEAVEASEEGAEPAESQERPAATEVADEKGPGEPEWPAEAEAEPGDLAEAGPEEPAEPEPEGLPEEPEKEEWEEEEEWEEKEDEDEEEAEVAAEPRRKEIPSQVSLQQATAGKEEAAPDREAEREGQLAEEGEESEESEKKLVQGGLGKTEDELGDLDEGLELGSCDWTEEVRTQQEQQLRAELLEQYRSLMVARGRYQRYNIYLQHKIFEALRKKKGLDAAEVPEKGAEPEAPRSEEHTSEL